MTIVSWLNVYVQVAYVNDTSEVLMPQYPQQVFVQIAEVCGLSASPPCVWGGGCTPQLTRGF